MIDGIGAAKTAGKKGGRGEEAAAAAEEIYTCTHTHSIFFSFLFCILAENRFDPGRRVEPRVPRVFALHVSGDGEEERRWGGQH